jgi:hypothetical protein
VVPDETFGVLRIGITNQRSYPAPRRQHVSAPDLDIGRQVVLDFVEDPLDFFLGRNGVCGHGSGRVGRSGDDDALPWEEEDDSAVGRGRVQETEILRPVVILLISGHIGPRGGGHVQAR